MMEIKVIIQNYKVYCYKDNKRIYLSGYDQYTFGADDLANKAKKFLMLLCKECNCQSEQSLTLNLLTDFTGKAFISFLSEKTKVVVCDNTSVLRRLLSDISEKNELEVDRFGVNYGDVCYKIYNNKLRECDYDISAYTVTADNLIAYI